MTKNDESSEAQKQKIVRERVQVLEAALRKIVNIGAECEWGLEGDSRGVVYGTAMIALALLMDTSEEQIVKSLPTAEFFADLEGDANVLAGNPKHFASPQANISTPPEQCPDCGYQPGDEMVVGELRHKLAAGKTNRATLKGLLKDSEAMCLRAAEELRCAKEQNAELQKMLATAEYSRDHYREREEHFAKALSVADNGQYRADWYGAISRVITERNAAHAHVEVLEAECASLKSECGRLHSVGCALYKEFRHDMSDEQRERYRENLSIQMHSLTPPPARIGTLETALRACQRRADYYAPKADDPKIATALRDITSIADAALTSPPATGEVRRYELQEMLTRCEQERNAARRQRDEESRLRWQLGEEEASARANCIAAQDRIGVLEAALREALRCMPRTGVDSVYDRCCAQINAVLTPPPTAGEVRLKFETCKRCSQYHPMGMDIHRDRNGDWCKPASTETPALAADEAATVRDEEDPTNLDGATWRERCTGLEKELHQRDAALGRAVAALQIMRSRGMPRGSTYEEQQSVDAILADPTCKEVKP